MENQIKTVQNESPEAQNRKECKMSVYRYIGAMLILIVVLLTISHMVQYRNTQRLERELAGAQKNISEVADREKGVSARYAQLQTEFQLVQSRLSAAEENLAQLKEEKEAEVGQLLEETARLKEEKEKLAKSYDLLFALEKEWRGGNMEAAASVLSELEKDNGQALLQSEALALYEQIKADLQKAE